MTQEEKNKEWNKFYYACDSQILYDTQQVFIEGLNSGLSQREAEIESLQSTHSKDIGELFTALRNANHLIEEWSSRADTTNEDLEALQQSFNAEFESLIQKHSRNT